MLIRTLSVKLPDPFRAWHIQRERSSGRRRRRSQKRALRGATLIKCLEAGAVLVALLLASPGQALDFSSRVLIYQEDFDGEAVFPTVPEVDELGLGGLLASAPPREPTLTGTAAHLAVFGVSGSLEQSFVSLVGQDVGTGRVGHRIEIENPQIPNVIPGEAAFIRLIVGYQTPTGDSVSIIVSLARFDDETGGGSQTIFALQEFDALGVEALSEFQDLTGSSFEAILLAGASFGIDLTIDPGEAEGAAASIDIAGAGQLIVAIPALPDGGTYVKATVFSDLLSPNPSTSLQADLTNYQIFLDEGENRFNLDVGDVNGVPSRTYAAAGEAGFWNVVTGTHPLNRADGSVSPATVSLSALSTSGTGGAAGDPGALLSDSGIDCAAVPTIWQLSFAGLENGDYEVLVYAPRDTATPTGPLSVGGISSPSLPGDFGLGLIQGTSYESFLVPVTDGTLGISGIDEFFQSFCIGIAGVQLERQVPEPGFLPGLFAGILLLAGMRRRPDWSFGIRSLIPLVVSVAFLLAASSASSVEFLIVGPDSVTVAPGEQFTIELLIRNESLFSFSELAASVHGYDGVASFESGEAVPGYLYEFCAVGIACISGLDNLVPQPLSESSIGANGPRVQIALSSGVTSVSNDGSFDIGLDFQLGSPQFSLTFTAQGPGQILIGTSYPGDGVDTFFEASGAVFTVNEPPPPFATLEISDDTFAPGNWATTTMAAAGGATEQVQSLSTGGNPTDYRQTELFIPGVASIEVFHGFTGASFTPALQGPIDSVDYDEDRIQLNPPFGGAVAGASAGLRQDGTIYRGPSSNFSSTSWESLSLSGLTPTDFDDGSGGQPDFSSTGGPMQFGFIRRSSSGNSGSTFTITSGIDNWSNTLFYTPTPQTLFISDETFEIADWSTTITDVTGGATHQAQHSTSDGNPDDYRFMELFIPGVASIEVFHAFEAASFSPNAQGSIVEVDYAEDLIALAPPFTGAAFASAPALTQDGVVYIGPSTSFSNTSWTTSELLGLVADSFDDGTGQHPNFSESGGDIRFGYVRRSSSGNAGSTFSIDSGTDNWSFAVRYVPEPVATAGLAYAFAALACMHRRHSRANRVM